MKVIKRSQVAIISLSLMLMIAGYINYKYDPEREANLGETVHVSSKDGFMYSNVNIYKEKENKNKTNAVETDTKNMYNEKKKDDAIAAFRSSRNDMFSELQENYAKVIQSNSTTAEQLTEYQNKLNELVENKHKISIVEELIKSKGISDVVIVPLTDSLNVILSDDEEIGEDKIAMVQKIIEDELGFPASKITINVP